jgi:hypothetical protein
VRRHAIQPNPPGDIDAGNDPGEERSRHPSGPARTPIRRTDR